jgi:hypothetical protein
MQTTYYFDDRDEFIIADFAKIKTFLHGKKMQSGDVEFIPHSENITHQQRKYFYGLLAKMICERLNFLGTNSVTVPDVVNFLKDKFLYYEKMCPITGKYIKIPYSLGNNDEGLPIEIFTEKKELIQQFGAEILDIQIPEPNPNYKMYKK